MRDPRYWYDSYGFEHRRELADYVLLGILALASPVWGPFWLLGRGLIELAGVVYVALHKEDLR